MRRPSFIIALLVAAACACTGGGSKDKQESAQKTESASPPAKQVLTVYSGRTDKLIAPVFAEFEKQTGVEVKVKYADTAQLAATVLEEGERSPADVFVAQDASTLAMLEAKNILGELPAAVLAPVDGKFKSKIGRWVGVSGRARVLAYNTQKLKPENLPASAADLTRPEWKGRVGWAPENASLQSAVAAMIQLEGEEAAAKWVKDMQANQPRAYPKNAPAVVAVSRGEVDVALVNHYYLYRLRAEHGADFPVANHYFRSGKADSLVNVSGAAVLRSSKNKELGETLVAYLLSEPSQRFFAETNHEFPVIAGVKTPLDLPDINSLNAPDVDLTKLEDLAATHKLLREAGALP